MRGFFDKASGLTSGWQGINSALVDSATSIAQALGGLAGARKAGGGRDAVHAVALDSQAWTPAQPPPGLVCTTGSVVATKSSCADHTVPPCATRNAGAKVGAALSAPNGALASLASFAASG